MRSHRTPPPTLAACEARARVVTAERVAADLATARAARIADMRARLALAEAARAVRPVIGTDVYSHPPTAPTVDARAASERAVPGIIRAADHLAAERHSDALAAVPENHTAYDWSRP